MRFQKAMRTTKKMGTYKNKKAAIKRWCAFVRDALKSTQGR